MQWLKVLAGCLVTVLSLAAVPPSFAQDEEDPDLDISASDLLVESATTALVEKAESKCACDNLAKYTKCVQAQAKVVKAKFTDVAKYLRAGSSLKSGISAHSIDLIDLCESDLSGDEDDGSEDSGDGEDSEF